MKSFVTHAIGLGLMLALAHAGYARSPVKSTDKPATDKPTAGASGPRATARHKSTHMHHSMMPSRTMGHNKFSRPNPAGKAPMMHRSRHVSHAMHGMPARHSYFSYGWRPGMGWSMPRYGWMNPYSYWPDRNGPVAMYGGSSRGWGYGHHHHYRGHHHHGHGHHHHRHA